MREKLLEAQKLWALGNMRRHEANVENLLNNPMGIGEHPDLSETISEEIKKVAEYVDILEVIEDLLERTENN
jgi:hypothetical protein|tara:strand:- start:449 stop:664 length:216 start_codon:yes stop_codon:yes gene_type:complete